MTTPAVAPKRIQLRRTAGWRKPAGAVVVARPTRWGNPYLLSPVGHQFPSFTTEQCQGYVVNQFKDLVGYWRLDRVDPTKSRAVTDSVPNPGLRGTRIPRTCTYPSLNDIRGALAGHDLACWCSLDEPCHADVLLELANPELSTDRGAES